MIDVNPLSVLNKRSLKWLPPHFSKVSLPMEYMLLDNKIEDWIKYKLKGRYCIVTTPNGTNTVTTVGFEQEKELTYFMLACPHIRS